MANIPDLVRDSKLEAYYLPHCNVETVHQYHEPDPKSRRRLVTRTEHWQRRKKVGSGAYGSVWVENCTQGARSDRKIRAVKQIDINGRFGPIDYNRELEVIAKFSHSRYERCFVKSLGWYDSPEYLLIAMEYLEAGDLLAYLHTRPALPEVQAQEITYQILDGLNMMHDNNFAHRDLKPNNILIQSHPPDEWWVKISDFGISKRIEEAPGASTTLRGTSGYIAPELYGLVERGTPFASDIWALGQIVFQLLTKEMAFKHLGSLASYVMKANQFPTGGLTKSSALSVEFISSLMCAIPNDRITAAMAISHTWIKSRLGPSGSETSVSTYTSSCMPSYTQDLSTTTSTTESFASWNTKASYPAPGIVNHGEKYKSTTGSLASWNTKPSYPAPGVVNHGEKYKSNTESLASWNTKASYPAPGIVNHGEKYKSSTESLASWNTKASYPAPGIVNHVPKSHIGSRGVDMRLWRAFDLRNFFTLTSKVAFSPNGEWLAIPDGKHARLCNTSDGTEVRPSINQNQDIHVAAFSPDGKYIATGGTRLVIWDVPTGLKVPRIHLNVDHIAQYVSFSPDSSLVACSSASMVGVWNIQSGQKLSKFSLPTSIKAPLTFASIGKRLIYYTSGDYRVRTQDLSTGDFFISSTPPASPGKSVPTFSPNGRYLAFSYGSGICVLDTTKKTPKVDTPTVRPKLFSLIHKGPPSYELDMSHVESPNHWFKVELNYARVRALAFSPSGKVLATCVCPKGNQLSWKIVLWNVVESGNGTFKLEELHNIGEYAGDYGHDDDRHLIFSPDGKFLACTSIDDRTVRVWKAVTGK